jgi:hypothetical protein
MSILNYTTKVDSWKTISEIQQLLAKAGASHINIKNEGSQPSAISFSLTHNNYPLNFLLPCNMNGVLKLIKKQGRVRNELKDGDAAHAARVSWRIIKDWIEAQNALILVDMASMATVFLPYLVVNETGETLSEKMLVGNGMKLLSNGS